MLEVSQDAKKRLHRSLTSSEDQVVGDKCFRIVPTSHELFLTLKLARPKGADETYEHKGRVILALPESLQQKCANKRLDIGSRGRLEFA